MNKSMREVKQPSKKSYLERITIDVKAWNSPVRKYITNFRIVFLLLLAITFLGIASYLNLPQRLNPEIKIPIITVVTVLPGANPEDVEHLVTIPLEDKLHGLRGLDAVSSVSRDNVSLISLQFLNSVGQDKAKQLVKDAVDSVIDLPTDSKTPQVEALDFENQPVWQFAITTTKDIISLSQFSRMLKKEIEQLALVDSVIVRGIEAEEIQVKINSEKMNQYGLNPITLSTLIKSALKSFPAGSIESSALTYAFTIDPQVESVDQIRNIRIHVDSIDVLLRDVADISLASEPNIARAYTASASQTPQKSVTFSIYKSTNADIVKTVDAISALVTEKRKAFHNEFTLQTIDNTGERIRTQFFDLLGEFRSTILLVFGCLFLFLGLRQALIASFTVPLTFLSAFIFMHIFGMSINFLSLFAFLLSLGLLVDDTIVVVSAMTTYYKTKRFTPEQTGVLVWRDTIVPIWSTTITTIWSFVPLLLSSGIIGEFIKPIPVVVTITMVSSTAIAVLITLPIMIILLKPAIPIRVVKFIKIVSFLLALAMLFATFATNPMLILIVILFVIIWFLVSTYHSILRASISKSVSVVPALVKLRNFIAKSSSTGLIDIAYLSEKYERFITRILQSKSARRNVVIGITIYAVFSFLLLPLGLVKSEFFPKSEGDIIFVSLELPPGTPYAITEAESIQLLNTFRNAKGVEFVTAEIGASAPSSIVSSGSDQTNISLFSFHLPPKKERKIGSLVIADTLRFESKQYTAGKLSIIEESGGPPAGAEVQIELSGDDLGTLDEIASQLTKYLSTVAGVINIEKSIKPGTSAVVLVPDLEKLVAAGVSRDQIGIWMRTILSGFQLDSMNLDDTSSDKTAITLRVDTDTHLLSDFTKYTIPTSQGMVPIASLGTLAAKTNPTNITRENGKRTITVSSGLKIGYSSGQINAQLLKFAQSLPIPSGYSWKTGGVNEENQKSVQSILTAMVLAFLLILVTMVLQFQSFRQAIIVLLVIPLAVSSVFLIFALTGTPLSFPALIGVLSLFGIVVTNSMFIVDKINLNRKEGMPFTKAIADAGASRMEPIILTKLCTVFGLLPISLADPLWRGLGGAIISGLLIASTIMLLFIPVVYYSWMNNEPSNEAK